MRFYAGTHGPVLGVAHQSSFIILISCPNLRLLEFRRVGQDNYFDMLKDTHEQFYFQQNPMLLHYMQLKCIGFLTNHSLEKLGIS